MQQTLPDRRGQRNSAVELYRFLFCMLVMLHHTYIIGAEGNYPFRGAYLCVEFFFMLSGFYTLRHIDRAPKEEYSGREAEYAVRSTLARFQPIFLYAAICVPVHYIFEYIYVYHNVRRFCYMPFEMFLLQMSGLDITFSIIPLWYVSCLLLTLPVLIYMLTAKRELTENLLAILLPLVIYGYFRNKYGGIYSWHHLAGFTFDGNFRAAAGLFLGCLAYSLTKKTSLTKCQKRLVMPMLAAVTCAAIYILYSYYRLNMDFVAIALFFLLLLLLQAEPFRCWNVPFINLLGALSLPLYMCHWTVGRVIEKLCGGWEYNTKLIMFMTISIVYAALLLICARTINDLAARKN